MRPLRFESLEAKLPLAADRIGLFRDLGDGNYLFRTR